MDDAAVPQIHDLVHTVIRSLSRSPVLQVPTAVRREPVDVRDVARRLVEVKLGEPAGP